MIYSFDINHKKKTRLSKENIITIKIKNNNHQKNFCSVTFSEKMPLNIKNNSYFFKIHFASKITLSPSSTPLN